MLADFDTLQVFLGKAEMKLLKGNNKRADNRVRQHTKVYSDSAHLHYKLVKSSFYFSALISFGVVAFVGSKEDRKCLCNKYFTI